MQRYRRAEQARIYKRERDNHEPDLLRFRQIYDRFGAHFAGAFEQEDIARVHALTVGESVEIAGVRYTRLGDRPLRPIARVRTTGMCGCCGGDAQYRANVRGADGVYFSRLCGYCFEDFVEDGYFDVDDPELQTVGELLGDDLDGIQSMVTP